MADNSSSRRKTYLWYLNFLHPYAKTVSSLTVDQLKPYHVTEWVNANQWGDLAKRGAITAVKRCFSWASNRAIATNLRWLTSRSRRP